MPATCGVIAAKAEIESGRISVEFTAAHCAPSLAFAYLHQGLKVPISKVDRTQNRTVTSSEPSIAVFGVQTSWKGEHMLVWSGDLIPRCTFTARSLYFQETLSLEGANCVQSVILNSSHCLT